MFNLKTLLIATTLFSTSFALELTFENPQLYPYSGEDTTITFDNYPSQGEFWLNPGAGEGFDSVQFEDKVMVKLKWVISPSPMCGITNYLYLIINSDQAIQSGYQFGNDVEKSWEASTAFPDSISSFDAVMDDFEQIEFGPGIAIASKKDEGSCLTINSTLLNNFERIIYIGLPGNLIMKIQMADNKFNYIEGPNPSLNSSEIISLKMRFMITDQPEFPLLPPISTELMTPQSDTQLISSNGMINFDSGIKQNEISIYNFDGSLFDNFLFTGQSSVWGNSSAPLQRRPYLAIVHTQFGNIVYQIFYTP